MLDRIPDAEIPGNGILHIIQGNAVVEPGYLCSSLLQKLLSRICLSKRPHVHQVARGNPFITGNSRLMENGVAKRLEKASD
jgi:hypothetical protein